MTTTATPSEPAARATTVDEAKLHAVLGRIVNDLGSTFGTAMALIGDRLGLYRALAEAGPLAAAELARRTGTVERYVREWLVNQAAAGYVAYDPMSGRYTLPAEQALALADVDGPFFAIGGYQVARAMLDATERIVADFRRGEGLAWGEHHHDLFEGTFRFFRASYLRDLVDRWIPALDGVRERLEAGATVADVGCGWGTATIILAQAFPKSRFVGFDLHAPSVERARELARAAGVSGQATFEVAPAHAFRPAMHPPSAGTRPARGYDLIAFFDCFHDLPDPEAVARHAYELLAPEGTLMLVEPMAGETVEENLTPVGRVFSGASVLCCTPNALAGGGAALGTIASDTALLGILRDAGFTRARRATETPFNRVFEARR